MEKIKLIKGDCLIEMEAIESKSVDVIFADLPYQTTNCKWDVAIPLEDYMEFSVNKRVKRLCRDKSILELVKQGCNYKEACKLFSEKSKRGLWFHYNRIIKDNGVILLTAQTPFDKVLGCSNLSMLRYEWIWEKTQATGHLNAKKMPMKAHENVLVFYKKLPTYNPQKTTGHVRKVSLAKSRILSIDRRRGVDSIYNDECADGVNDYDSTERYPRSVQIFASDKQKSKLHSTQKPVKFVKYMIKTYAHKGAVVLDNVMGSGTTGVAVVEINNESDMELEFIGIEKGTDIFNVAKNRIENAEKSV